MEQYLYRWRLISASGVRVEVEIQAANAIGARREVTQFLREHDGAAWSVQSVSRDLRFGASRGIPIAIGSPRPN